MEPGIDRLADAIDALFGDGVETCADRETIARLYTLRTRLDAFVASGVAAFDASGAYELDGAKNAPTWLACELGIDKRAARRDLRRGRACRELVAVASAWSGGNITGDHVDAIVRVRRPATRDVLARDEKLLVEQATKLRFDQFARALRYWEQCADERGAEEEASARRERRELHLDQSFEGQWLGRMVLDPISGAIVSSELRRLEEQLFQADWAEAHERLGCEPTPTQLARTPAQRRADALVEMATRSRAMPPDARRPRPLFSVLIGYETLRGRICELEDGTVVAPGTLLPYLSEAELERAIYAPNGRIEVGARARLFTGATRRALELRDRECTHEFCDMPAEGCEGDHIEPYSAGGFTTQENGQLQCGFHNRLRETERQRTRPERPDVGAGGVEVAERWVTDRSSTDP